MEKWIVGQPGGPAGPFYSVVSERGRVIAMQIIDHGMAKQIAQIPQLVALRAEWASIINRLAHLALDGCNSNDRDYAEDMIDMVLPYLEVTPAAPDSAILAQYDQQGG
jgi:hypothetical protein